MPVFVEDPTQFSKSRLKSDLIAHNVALPPGESKKEVYVELYLKHIHPKNEADFSSDEEEPGHDAAEMGNEKNPDPSTLTDDRLKAMLLKHGVKAGPIVASTRALYERRLKKLLQPDAKPKLNGTGDAALYSDSEEDEVKEAEEEEEGEEEESGSEQVGEETESQPEKTHQDSGQGTLSFQKAGCHYNKSFLPSSTQHACSPEQWEQRPMRNAGNVVESSSERGQTHCPQIPTQLSRTSFADQPTGLGSGVERRNPLSSGTDRESSWSKGTKLPRRLPEEPETDVLREIFPDTAPSLTGITVTCRRPIKGAAGRPIQCKYTDIPLSPKTLQRQQVDRRVVPVKIQILIFLIMACLLFLIYTYMEENSFNPFVGTLDDVTLSAGGEEEPLLPAETEELLPGRE